MKSKLNKLKTDAIPEYKVDDSIYLSPKEFWTNPNRAKPRDIKRLIKLIDNNSSETAIDRFLSKYPELLTLLMREYHTGHQHSWVIPKRVIKTKFYKDEKGQIPDYILGGQSTSGREWFIIELKGANVKQFILKNNKIFFSSTINEGVNQLLEYLHYSDKYQAKFRDEFKMLEFNHPRAILIAGRRSEFEHNERKKALRKEWETVLGDRIKIVTYDRFKDQLVGRLKDFDNDKKNRYFGFNPFINK